MPVAGTRHGRIHPHQRETDHTKQTIGANIQIENFETNLHKTKDLEMLKAIRQDYRNRIRQIIEYWEGNLPDYATLGVRNDLIEDQTNITLYYFNGAFNKDIVYLGLNMKMFLKFLIQKKDLGDGKIISFNDIQKYKDAVIWGSKIVKTLLPATFYQEAEAFFKGYKKLVVKKRKEGMIDEEEADPITHTLFKLLLHWAIKSNNIFVWFWSIVQWNCMARGTSVDPLGFYNTSLGTYLIRVKYDNSKTKKSGDRLSIKNIYANPFDYSQCFHLGLRVYCCIFSNKLSASEKLFIKQGTKGRTASNRY